MEVEDPDMLTRSLCLMALLGMFTSGACGGGSGKAGTGGNSGTGDSGGGTGGAGGAGGGFMAVAPCAAASDYQSGTTIEFPNADMTYSPKCLKAAVGSSVTFMPMAGATFSMFPLSPSQSRGNTADNAIQMTETNSGSAKSFDFGVAGFYGFYCRKAGTDDTGEGMAGVIWVE